MPAAPRHPDHFLPLTVPVFHALMALADAERHGYGIIQEVAARTDGAVRLRTGTLYNAIRHMLRDGLVEESDERPDPALDDERRRYYRITTLGRAVARAEAQRLERMVAVARAKRVLGAGRAR